MKKPILAGLAAATFSVVCAVVAWAQPSSLPLPSGSWRDSCGDARAYYQNGGKVLSARCTRSGGGMETSSLRYDQCRGDIANSNGRLVCGNPGPFLPAAVPNGSYRQSCRNAVMNNGMLYAECRDSRGNWQRASIDPRNCNGRDIANINGRLTCGGGNGGGASLTLCTQPNFGGRCATITRDAPGLGPWEMANRAESARVSGRWTVCSEQDYRGRCVTLDRDERDLNRVGVSRRISSARPSR